MPQAIHWIQAKTVVTENEALSHGLVGLDQNGKIAEVITALQGKSRKIHPNSIFSEGILAPGFVEIHVHGLLGKDVMKDPELSHFISCFPQFGVCSFLLATITADEAQTLKTLKDLTKQSAVLENSGAEFIGFYLEGPFLCPTRPGAHPIQSIREPNQDFLKKLITSSTSEKNSTPLTKLIVMAPEVRGEVDECIGTAKDSGIRLSMGHSDADFDSAEHAYKKGYSQVTHLYNAMPPMHHRKPNLTGYALYNRELLTELICDGVHVHPAVITMTIRSKTEENIIAITDGISATGMPDGNYSLGPVDVIVKDQMATTANGSIAGSLLTMDAALRNLKKWMSYQTENYPKLFRMTSLNPARSAGIAEKKGSITKGKDADLILLNDSLEVQKTWCRGKLAYEKANP